MTALRCEKPIHERASARLRPPTLLSPLSLNPHSPPPRGGLPRDVKEVQQNLLWKGGTRGDAVLPDVLFLLR